jgi:hypothetical protein
MNNLLLTLFLLVSFNISIHSQTYLYEDFTNNMMPPAGWSVSNHPANWTTQNSYHAGGLAPEARFYWNPYFFDGSRLISYAIDLTGVNTVKLEFDHMLDHSDDWQPYYIGVATRSGSGGWNTVWEVSPDSSIGPEKKILVIDNINTGEPDFQFCFFVDGNVTMLNAWYFDNVRLFKPLNHDVAVGEFPGAEQYEPGESFEPFVLVKNEGSYSESFDVKCEIYDHNNTLLFSDTQNVANLLVNEGTWVNFNPLIFYDWDKLYQVKIVTLLPDDEDSTNNFKTKDLNTYSTERELVMVEIGTHVG